MTENIKRVNEVIEIIQKHLEQMCNDVYKTLPMENQTREAGHALTEIEQDLLKTILNEFSEAGMCE